MLKKNEWDKGHLKSTEEGEDNRGEESGCPERRGVREWNLPHVRQLIQGVAIVSSQPRPTV